MSIKVRRDTVANESVYIIIGINEKGYRDILDFYFGANASAEILTNLKERRVQ
nr:transposase [Halanaerobium hydrogeniformans]